MSVHGKKLGGCKLDSSLRIEKDTIEKRENHKRHALKIPKGFTKRWIFSFIYPLM